MTNRLKKYLTEDVHEHGMFNFTKGDWEMVTKSFGYRETTVKSCGSCEHYQGAGYCYNPFNVKIAMKLAGGGSLRDGVPVNSTGVCPEYNPRLRKAR